MVSRIHGWGWRIGMTALAVGLALGVLARQVQAQAPEKATVTVGTSVRDIGFLSIYVANAKGLWKREGLEVKLVTFRGGVDAFQATAGGAVDVMASAVTEPIDAHLSRQPIKAFWSVSNIPIYELWSRTDIKTPAQLKAKRGKVAVSGIGALSHTIAAFMLEKVGLTDRDIEFLAVGGPGERLAALRAGRVDAIPATPPGNLLLEEEGFNRLLRLRDVVKEFEYEVYYAREAFIRSHPTTLNALIRGTIRGIRAMKANPEEAAEILMRVINFPAAKRSLALRAVREVLEDFPEGGRFAEAGIDIFLNFYKKRGELKEIPKHDAFIDYSFTRAFQARPYRPTN